MGNLFIIGFKKVMQPYMLVILINQDIFIR